MGVRERTVSEIMQTEVAVVAPGERVDLADDIMRLGRVRHMPVVEDGRLVGMLSTHDVLAASLARVFDVGETHRRTFLRAVEVKDVMTKPVASVPPEASLREAAVLCVGRKLGCLPVVEDGDVMIGLVTATDLIRAAFLDDERPETLTIEPEEDVMTDVFVRIEQEIEDLRQVRDELRLQMHLAKSEVKDLWEGLELKLQGLESRARRFSRQAEEPLEDVAAAARVLLDEIRQGYRRIREAL